MFHKILLAMTVAFFALNVGSQSANAATKEYLDFEVQSALTKFQADTSGAKELFDKASGVLVFPRVLRAGIGWGGEFGEGALLIKGQAVPEAYYNIVSLSFGFQFGVEAKTVMFFFLTPEALKNFQNSSGWKVGVDGNVTVIAVGVGVGIDSNQINDPVVAFITDQRGLMYGLTLTGSKITKILK